MEVSLLCKFFKYSKASKLKQHSKFSMDLKLRTWRCAYDKQFCVGNRALKLPSESSGTGTVVEKRCQ